jgi:CHAT domain-containing protein/Tfp pilus assembly protein PilF
MHTALKRLLCLSRRGTNTALVALLLVVPHYAWSQTGGSTNQQVKREAAQAQSWLNAGDNAQRRSDPRRAIENYEKALESFLRLSNRQKAADTLTRLGLVYGRSLDQYSKAIDLFQQALLIQRKIGDRKGEALSLNNLGGAWSSLSQYAKAIDFFEKALVIERDIGDWSSEATTLNNLGTAYTILSQYAKAIDLFQQALAIDQRHSPTRGVHVLTNLGTAYAFLGQKDKAVDYYTKALAIERRRHNRAGQATTLSALGYAYNSLNQHRKAIGLFEEALAIERDIEDRSGQTATLNNLALAYRALKEDTKALGFLEAALPLARDIGDRYQEAGTLNNLAVLYESLNQDAKAIGFYELALVIQREIGDRAGEAGTLKNLMLSMAAQRRNEIAVLFGKQAINAYQQIRQDLTGLDENTRRTYLETAEDTYRGLAGILLELDRIAEAQQVLNLLKEEEFFHFARRDSAVASSLSGRADFTPTEAEWHRRYVAMASQLTTLGHERGELLALPSRTVDQEKRLSSLDNDLTIAGEAFQRFIADLDTEVSTQRLSKEKLDQVKDSEALMETLREIGTNTVVVYTLVTEDKLRLILITPEVKKTAESTIPRLVLNTKIVAFRQQLQNRTSDPRSLSKELYALIVGPIEKDLGGAKAETILWSLDGALRYLPIAALYDGERYMVERFQNVVFTPASNTNLKDVPTRQWRALGLGVSEAHDEFDPLPGAEKELKAIIRDDTLATTGVLPGIIKLNGGFTRDVMVAALRQRYRVVHIASHFEFKAGNEADSFLLLGDGGHLSLADVGKMENPFGGVELLTLSACDTATGGTANGKEVEGFGVQAQRKGAKAVIATLWRVADASTNELMQTFYRTRETIPEMTKAHALREAQLALLHGNDYRHPYYWAPFILIGNPR